MAGFVHELMVPGNGEQEAEAPKDEKYRDYSVPAAVMRMWSRYIARSSGRLPRNRRFA